MSQSIPSVFRAVAICSSLLLLTLGSAAFADQHEDQHEAEATGQDVEHDAAGSLEDDLEAETSPGEAGDEQATERLRRELREELLEELRAELDAQRVELEAEMRQAAPGVTEQQPRRWEVEPPPRPAFLELNGYFRGRGDVFVNFDMNAGVDVHGQPLFPTPATPGSNTLTTANQRLRLDPRINVSEQISVHATIDVLDNIVWGQTPDSFPRDGSGGFVPVRSLTETQVAPLAGVNAARDSLMVKRAWGEVVTPLGVLRLGRMGQHWGLGMLFNDGDFLDSDHGTTVDRLTFITMIGDHFVVPAIDIMSSGPIYQPRYEYQGQPFDLENRDDVVQYVLAIARRDSDEEVRRQVLDGRTVINYGLYNVVRQQYLDHVGPPTGPNGDRIHRDAGLSADEFITRDTLVYVPDVWFRLNTSRLRLELEVAAVLGRIGNGLLGEDADPADDTRVSITQIGAVAQGDYSLLQDRLRIGLETGYASGDRAPGMGILATRDGLSDAGAIYGRQFNVDPAAGPLDNTLNNFQFNRAYYIDEILWRRVLGRVTDAVYVKPSVAYDLTDDFGFDVSAIYSRAVFEESTPGDSPQLGLELNAGLRYQTADGFVMRGVYGILFPFGGLELEGDAPEIAQVIRAVVGITF